VSDGLPDDFPRLHRSQQFCDALLAMGPVFEELLVKLQRASPITCVIRDIRFPPVHERAKKLGIPVVGLATPSAISQQCVSTVSALISAGILPLPDPPPGARSAPSLHPVSRVLGPPRSAAEAAARRLAPLTSYIPGASPTLRLGDLPTDLLSPDLDEWFFRMHREILNPLLPDCECILFNTFHELEGDVLDAMTGGLNSNVLGVGPLILNSADGVEEVAVAGAPRSAMREEDAEALSWLDGREPNSVLFVSFGSAAKVSVEQMKAFALGLERSRHAFLWVIRSDAMCAMDAEFERMFSAFVTRTRSRALLVPWAPQTAVLSHPAVAAFFTHCGWNSTVESVAGGVPMFGWPRFADQATNSHYITHVWRIGLELQGLETVEDQSAGGHFVPKEEVHRKVKRIMAQEGTDLEVDEIRANSRKFAMAARKAVATGGSSQIALAKFVALAESWRTDVQPHAVIETCIQSHHPSPHSYAQRSTVTV
jgi:hypothetical protein